MTTPTGTIRTATERRLIEVWSALPGFADHHDDDDLWWVTGPIHGRPANRRLVEIGVADGPLDPDALAAGHGPTTDSWTISCAIACYAIADAMEAKETVEAGFNAVANAVAADHRLTPAGLPDIGVQQVRVVSAVGPYYLEPDGQPMAWMEFDVAAAAQIRRNP